MLIGLGCKEEPQVQAVPVDEYIKPDAPPTYAAPAKGSVEELTFKDITASAGLSFTHVNGAFGKKWMPETMGSGGAFFDHDGDSWPDILLINSSYWPGHEGEGPAPTPKLFRHTGDPEQVRYEDVTAEAGLDKVSCYGMGTAIADYDGDGDQDIYITAVGRNVLLRNDEGKYTDVTDDASVGFSSCTKQEPSAWEWSVGAMWLDYDHDGKLDLFVGNYVQWTPQTDIWATRDGKTKSYATPEKYQGATCVLFRNQGDGTFDDVTRQAGLFNPDGKSMAAVTDDFNDDGWLDIVVTNDTQPNFLYINNADGTFTDQALVAGIAYDEAGLTRAGMGIDVADLDNTGHRAIAIGNFSGEPVSLYTQAGGETFIDRAGATRLTKPTTVSLTFGVLFADFNLDGYQDLVLANGHIEPAIASVSQDWTFAQKPQLFLNNRAGKLVEVTDKAGPPFEEPIVGRGLACADIDRDGDLDVLLTTNAGWPKLLLNELAGDKKVARIRLVGPSENRDGIGARLEARVGDQTLTRWIRTGSSYLSQSELVATFGLGNADQIDELRIRWPDGSVQTVENVAAGSEHRIQQGAGLVDSVPLRS